MWHGFMKWTTLVRFTIISLTIRSNEVGINLLSYARVALVMAYFQEFSYYLFDADRVSPLI
jgi:hypothetical protein